MSQKRISIIGGNGYVGSVLAIRLLRAGHSVTVVNRGEYCNESDAIVYLSGSNRVGVYGDFDKLAELSTLKATVTVPCDRFLYASTCAVYGDGRDFTEESTLDPKCDYGVIKLAGEHIVLSVDGIVVRAGAACGLSPRMRWDLSVNAITRSAVVAGVMPVHTPDAMRPHVSVLDLAKAYEFLIEHGDCGMVYNVASENLTISQVGDVVSLETGVTTRIGSASIHDARSYSVNSDRIKNLGFEFRKPIESSIRDVVRFLRGLCTNG